MLSIIRKTLSIEIFSLFVPMGVRILKKTKPRHCYVKTKLIIKIITLLAFIGISPLSESAGIFSYITKSEKPSSGESLYEYVIESWDRNDTTPNPCYGEIRCAVSINHMHDIDGSGGASSSSFANPSISVGSRKYPTMLSARTMGELRSIVVPVTGMPIRGSIRHLGTQQVDECVGLFYTTKNSSNATFKDAHLLPGSVCGIAPPPVGVCNFTADNLTLDHGSINVEDTLNGKNINGNKVSATLGIQCSLAKRLRVIASTDNDGMAMLGNNLYSKVTMNSVPITGSGTVYNLPGGTTQFTIASELRSNGSVAPGNYNKVVNLILTLP